jgi:hypothetical protein
VSAISGRGMGIWGRQGRGGRDRASRLDYGRTVANGIWVDDPLDPGFSLKNQPGKVSGYAGSTYTRPSEVGS